MTTCASRLLSGLALGPGVLAEICWLQVPRLQAALARCPSAERRLLRLLGAEEAALCLGRARPAEGIAARLAAKAAFLRLLLHREQDGERGGVARPHPGRRLLYPLVEVVRRESGQPELRLGGELQQRTEWAGIGDLHLSLTHDRQVAGALVVACCRS
ncbi:MAG: hypothetical protein FJ125_00200 [Deltaproteobacteria bacterium]|nr:hypothetical protein [Deltaproteobacteria bacterium]